ncbi:hypothetical protein CHGG_08709 [Chaetomium globosum CBS 148.51]|uniref:Integrase catalytic domain-containing protein n=1 Tax=Chaetomium globosum (strain ATCC 6205 / CBS 148.51 / DSM 1962 / NBRC 6347 / NRRL 1970) TaxID=306901 RepID=Q2GTJ5_CHAGB|nr:uncharacterized protein CHGG_08709 [Chaetomium globosum CBS 148.51]EAQ84695.1 hypothetical protein CHGG_08709 [Chaetomium globosum CBS 148.51]
MELGDNGFHHQASDIKGLSDGNEVRQHPHSGGQTHQVELLPSPYKGVMLVQNNSQTVIYPQYGQTERLNQIVEQYLRVYINFQQDDWVELLPTAQLAYNTTVTETTKVTPFFANYGYEQTCDKGPTFRYPERAVKADRMSSLHAMLKEELEFVRTRMKKFYDRNRLEGPRLEEGGKVYLISRNLCTKRPSRKLGFRKIGPLQDRQKDFGEQLRTRVTLNHATTDQRLPHLASGTSAEERTTRQGR